MTALPQTSDFDAITRRRMQAGVPRSAKEPILQICIGIPYTKREQGKAYLNCSITLGNVERSVYFCVDAEFEKYLCYERADAFLIGILNIAMRERCDIRCLSPVTTELLHQLNTELIPALTKYDSTLYAPRITAIPDSSTLPCAECVGTGCSCGIDSLFAIKELTENGTFKPDYVTLNNVGAYTTHSTSSESLEHYNDNIENAQQFAKEHHLPLLVTNSNFADALPQNHLFIHLYSSAFAIFALRKLWKRYYYASTGYDLEQNFGLTNNHLHDAAKYDLIALNAFSIPSLRICNQGMCTRRFEKTKVLITYPPAHKYLNVCLNQGKGNCGYCGKCLRTLWTLDALDALEQFRQVFDIDFYKNNHSEFMYKLCLAHLRGVGMIDEAYDILRPRIPANIQKQALTAFRAKKRSTYRKEIYSKLKLRLKRMLHGVKRQSRA